MNQSRESILASLRHQPVPESGLPTEAGNWIVYDDPERQFIAAVESVGGTARTVDETELAAAVGQLPAYQNAHQRCCEVDYADRAEPLSWNVDLEEVCDPHDLASLDFALLPGRLAVAENGAVWVSDRSLRHRVVYFLTQHLALVVPLNKIVHNLHEAYAELSFRDDGFGCFISGPSKTADIEQSLVIGAHGARSLTVFLVRGA